MSCLFVYSNPFTVNTTTSPKISLGTYSFHTRRVLFPFFFFFYSYYSPTVTHSKCQTVSTMLSWYASYLRLFFVFNPSQIELRCLPYTAVVPISLARVSPTDFRVDSFIFFSILFTVLYKNQTRKNPNETSLNSILEKTTQLEQNDSRTHILFWFFL